DLESTDGIDRPLEEIRRLIDQAIGATRSLTFELSPPVLYELGLEAALQSLGERLGRRESIRFHFESDQEPKPLTDDKSVVLYRGGRELLYNIVKHAKANNAWMRVARDGDCIRITVEDDGVGFEACQAAESFTAGGGFGLFSMARQLDHIGGRLEMEPSPGQGTRIVVTAPLDAQQSSQGNKAVCGPQQASREKSGLGVCAAEN
ncbi:MAG: ATP-binding protein, partial [Acidobacteriota bacterium]